MSLDRSLDVKFRTDSAENHRLSASQDQRHQLLHLVLRGAQEAADELGNIELIYDGPTDGDPKKQAEMIEQWVVDGVDVICIAPNAPDVVAGAMKRLEKRAFT